MVIYRKYRPRIFADVVGQENIIKILKGALKRDKIGHAYLFSGPRGTGKTTIARILAKAVNCQNLDGDFEPCNKCGVCVEINEGRSLDFVEIDAASNRGIDEIRQLRDSVNFSPAKNKYRVFILDEVHMLTKEAFNALLKTLEEPPAHTLFVLATTEIHKIPATIISRCQHFNFMRISADKIANLLFEISKKEQIQAEMPALEIIARNSDGCIRDAESIFGQIAMMINKKITVESAREMLGLPNQEAIEEFSKSILNRDPANAISQVDKILQGGKDLYTFASSLIYYLRCMLMLKISNDLSDLAEKDYGSEDLDRMREISAKAGKNSIVFALKKIIEAHSKMRYSDFPNLYLEIAAAEIALQYDTNETLPNNGKSDNIKHEDEALLAEQAKQASDNSAIETSHHDVSSEDENTEELLKMVRERWEEILLKVKEKNHSVHAFLKICIPAKISSGDLFIAVSYQFYKERLNTTQNRLIVESVIGEVLKTKLRIKPFTKKDLADMGVKLDEQKLKPVNQKENKSNNNQDDLLSEALKMFGGTVVETQ